jgi:hypothetical protein
MHFIARSRLNVVLSIAAAFAAVCAIGAPAYASDTDVDANLIVCTPIKTAADMQKIRQNLAGTYCLANDIDMTSIVNFVPIGTADTPFTGRFFGKNHVIVNLTIGSALTDVGLFGNALGAVFQDVGLVDARVSATSGSANVGGLVGFAQSASGGATTISRVFVTGKVSCPGSNCTVGGIAGSLSFLHVSVTQSWSSANVSAGQGATIGGAFGFSAGDITSSYATGSVTAGDFGRAGGLIGVFGVGLLTESYATGPVSAGASATEGGLIAFVDGDTTRIERTYAAGPIACDGTGAGGLIGDFQSGLVFQSYSIGRINCGGTVGGLIGQATQNAHVFDSYWDVETSNQTNGSSGGTGEPTANLRGGLLPGFDSAWAITKNRSYPFLNNDELDFASPLATLVLSAKVFVALPISQLDDGQYITPPVHPDQAALAAVYTMFARAVSVTDNVKLLRGVKIDQYFWDDATQTASFAGPVTAHATLAALKTIASATPMDNTNVIAYLKKQRLVILRGTYTKSGGSIATHWMLATLYTTDAANNLATVVAHDPWTGQQIEIDPASKTVVTPGFPLRNFVVDGYQPVAID